MKNLTIKEIAKMAGVSPTAVSFVINKKGGVSEATAEKINKVISETGFVPSLNSKRLLMNKSFNINIVFNSITSQFEDLFYFEVTKGILAESKNTDYNIVISESKKPGKPHRLPDIVYSGGCDGIIFFQNVESEILEEAEKTGIPFVIVDAPSINEAYTAIIPDYETAAYSATEYLIKNGHKKIGFMTYGNVPSFYSQTSKGFERCMNEYSLPIQDCLISANVHDEESAYNEMKHIIDYSPKAMMCAVDILALGAMRSVKQRGLRVPDDISFIGIDDILLSAYSEPKLTTVRINKSEMGKIAMKTIISKINGGKCSSIVIPAQEVIIRESVLNTLY